MIVTISQAKDENGDGIRRSISRAPEDSRRAVQSEGFLALLIVGAADSPQANNLAVQHSRNLGTTRGIMMQRGFVLESTLYDSYPPTPPPGLDPPCFLPRGAFLDSL